MTKQMCKVQAHQQNEKIPDKRFWICDFHHEKYFFEFYTFPHQAVDAPANVSAQTAHLWRVPLRPILSAQQHRGGGNRADAGEALKNNKSGSKIIKHPKLKKMVCFYTKKERNSLLVQQMYYFDYSKNTPRKLALFGHILVCATHISKNWLTVWAGEVKRLCKENFAFLWFAVEIIIYIFVYFTVSAEQAQRNFAVLAGAVRNFGAGRQSQTEFGQNYCGAGNIQHSGASFWPNNLYCCWYLCSLGPLFFQKKNFRLKRFKWIFINILDMESLLI